MKEKEEEDETSSEEDLEEEHFLTDQTEVDWIMTLSTPPKYD